MFWPFKRKPVKPANQGTAARASGYSKPLSAVTEVLASDPRPMDTTYYGVNGLGLVNTLTQPPADTPSHGHSHHDTCSSGSSGSWSDSSSSSSDDSGSSSDSGSYSSCD